MTHMDAFSHIPEEPTQPKEEQEHLGQSQPQKPAYREEASTVQPQVSQPNATVTQSGMSQTEISPTGQMQTDAYGAEQPCDLNHNGSPLVPLEDIIPRQYVVPELSTEPAQPDSQTVEPVEEPEFERPGTTPPQYGGKTAYEQAAYMPPANRQPESQQAFSQQAAGNWQTSPTYEYVPNAEQPHPASPLPQGLPQGIPQYPGSYAEQDNLSPSLDKPLYGASFTQAVRRFFTKYVVFSGRASRSEFWWFILFNVIVGAIISGVMSIINRDASTLVSTLWTIAIFIPFLALSIRRLHDSNKSGWWILLPTIPLIVAQIFSTYISVRFSSLSRLLTGKELVEAVIQNLSGALLTVTFCSIVGLISGIVLMAANTNTAGIRFDQDFKENPIDPYYQPQTPAINGGYGIATSNTGQFGGSQTTEFPLAHQTIDNPNTAPTVPAPHSEPPVV